MLKDFIFDMISQMTLTPVAKVRHRILRMFGGLGGETNILLLDDTERNPSNAVVWDTENHLTFAVPFQDMKPSIYLGKLPMPFTIVLAWPQYVYCWHKTLAFHPWKAGRCVLSCQGKIILICMCTEHLYTYVTLAVKSLKAIL